MPLLIVRPDLESIKFPELSTIRVLELEAPLLFTVEPLVEVPLFTEELLFVEVAAPLFTDELLDEVPAVLLYVSVDLPLSPIRLTALLDDPLVRPEVLAYPDDLPLLDAL